MAAASELIVSYLEQRVGAFGYRLLIATSLRKNVITVESRRKNLAFKEVAISRASP
jgi:hypothetical protein